MKIEVFRFMIRYLLIHFGVLLFLLSQATMAAKSAVQSSSKKNLCTVTINSNNESELFKRNLSPSDWNFIELAPKSAETASKNWFNEACQQNIRCDVLVISGHFAGSFFGNTNLKLSMEDLERNSCDQKCDGILKQPREVFLFGCNTLASKEKDSRSPEEYMQVLLGDGFSTEQASQIVSFRYSGFGDSYKQRMTQVFATTPRIYGFSSIGPSGSTVEPMLQSYLHTNAKDYADYGTYVSKSGTKTNLQLSLALDSTSLTQATGAIPLLKYADEKPYCYIRNEQRSSVDKLRYIQNLFQTGHAIKILPHIEEFLQQLKNKKTLSPEEQNILTELATDQKLKSDLIALLQLTGDVYLPLKTHVLNTLKDLNLVSSQFISKAYNELIDLNSPFTNIRSSTLCSLQGQIIIPTSIIPTARYRDYEFITAMMCLKLNDKVIQNQVADTISIATDPKLKLTAIWFFYQAPTDDVAIQSILATALRDDLEANIRQSAITVLRYLKPKNLAVINLIVQAFIKEKNSEIKEQIEAVLASVRKN